MILKLMNKWVKKYKDLACADPPWVWQYSLLDNNKNKHLNQQNGLKESHVLYYIEIRKDYVHVWSLPRGPEKLHQHKATHLFTFTVIICFQGFHRLY